MVNRYIIFLQENPYFTYLVWSIRLLLGNYSQSYLEYE